MVPHHLKIVPGEMSQIVGLFQEVQKELEMQRPLWTELVKTKLLEYFILMRRAALGPALPVLADNPLMNQLLAYLDGNYMRPLSLSQLSGHFGFSAFYLSHCFSRFTGIGIKRYILQRRIAEAQLIMEKQSNLKLTAVARQIGFKDYAVFNRAFFKIVHVSPSAYRK
jgi:AraC-like DNA-binding protein